MNEDIKKYVYSQPSIEFVTVAVQYCILLENPAEDITKDKMTDQLTKLLPLLYLKTSLVPDTEMMEEDMPEVTVTEEIYNYVVQKMRHLFAENDAYLEVFLHDMKYSDTPIAESISENLGDIYQDLKNCVTIYERGIEETMNDALYICMENFRAYWGQKLVNVLRALHTLKYAIAEDEEEKYKTIDESEELW